MKWFNMEKCRKILTRLLLAFVLISIGFALGRHSLKNHSLSQVESPASGQYVTVYYMHATFRCETCNTIEKMTRELLDKAYAAELADGRIKWQEVDFQEDEPLAEKFGVVASCVVVTRVEEGKIVDFKRLDEVWTLMQNPGQFNQYISAAINLFLGRNGGNL